MHLVSSFYETYKNGLNQWYGSSNSYIQNIHVIQFVKVHCKTHYVQYFTYLKYIFIKIQVKIKLLLKPLGFVILCFNICQEIKKSC